MNQLTVQVVILVVFIGAMYLLLIRPQKKKEKDDSEYEKQPAGWR